MMHDAFKYFIETYLIKRAKTELQDSLGLQIKNKIQITIFDME